VLIGFAYPVPDDRIIGGPNWLRRDRFDVIAKADKEAPLAQLRLMMQGLLRERFGLAVTMEQREVPMYALVLARSDGRLGKSLERAAENCDTLEVQSAGPGTSPTHGRAVERTLTPTQASNGSRWMGDCLTAGGIANHLTGVMGVEVIDNTGLKGRWKYAVRYSGNDVLSATSGIRSDSDLPPLSVALPQQLGLKLERTRAFREVLVIDSVHQPTEN
jgi:uncharacterized protein (TIGR03435 family)